MIRSPRGIACVLLASCILVPACGGGGKKSTKQPIVKNDPKTTPPPPETEEDREKKREAAARQLVPEGKICLPPAVKESGLRLDIAQVDSDVTLCAVDAERDRLLGMVACWKLDLLAGGMTYEAAKPLPGHGFSVKVDAHCARGFCLPKDAKSDAKVAHIVWNGDATKVAVNFGDDIHIFDAASKAHESNFSIRGDKGITAADPVRLSWVADTIFVEASDGAANQLVYAFKAEGGAPGGALESMGKPAKPVSTRGGTFVVLDKKRVAIAEQGFSSLTIYEVATGARSKLVRKLPKSPCKTEETDAYWAESMDKVGAKCKEFMTKTFAHFVGSDVMAGTKSFVTVVREPRVGELILLDNKTLAESRAIKLPACDTSSPDEVEKESSSK